ncbi:hypothetical protein AGLY_005648 [Aphis glycines]|uniref:TMEM62 C-terminal domain-containing protein n=1 Tax=Aphis glycines TaxID=307491 RepID=A0A6G0TTC7_APHGL|nr:hypothetical protein AGLY_005648 [Aphis glycines]
MMFVIASLANLLPLLVYRFVSKCTKYRINYNAKLSLIKRYSRKMILLSSVNRIFYTMLLFYIYLCIGPWAIGELVTDLIGWVFPWGIYVKGKLIKDSFIYAYGFGQILTFQLPLNFILSHRLDKRMQSLPNTQYTFITSPFIYVDMIFFFLIIWQIVCCLWFFGAYGWIATIFGPLKTWSIFIALWLWNEIRKITINEIRYATVDYYSKFKGSHAKLVITQLKSIFARFGIPMEIISDNGPSFNTQEFKLFAERCVQIVKKLLKKASDTNTDPYIALMQYRNTANRSLCSPAQLLMSRNLRTKIPVILSSLKPKLVEVENYNKQISTKNDKVMSYNNKNAKQLSHLKSQEKIKDDLNDNTNKTFLEKSIETNLQAKTKNRLKHYTVLLTRPFLLKGLVYGFKMASPALAYFIYPNVVSMSMDIPENAPLMRHRIMKPQRFISSVGIMCSIKHDVGSLDIESSRYRRYFVK